MRDWAEMAGIEFLLIDAKNDPQQLRKEIRWNDDGAQRHTVWEIHVRELLLLDSKTSGVEDADEAATQQEAPIAPVGGQASQGNSAGNSRPRATGPQPHQNHGR